MKTIIALLAFVLAGLTTTPAQEKYEYGKPADLKGLTRIFIHTMGDLKEQERIQERLTKQNVPNLKIVEDIKDAEIVLVFGGDSFTTTTGATANRVGDSVYATTQRIELLAGEGRVFVAGTDGKLPRLVMRVSNEQNSKLEKRPVTKFVNQFVKVYREVNGLEKD